jgi:hypothetical protein
MIAASWTGQDLRDCHSSFSRDRFQTESAPREIGSEGIRKQYKPMTPGNLTFQSSFAGIACVDTIAQMTTQYRPAFKISPTVTFSETSSFQNPTISVISLRSGSFQ